MKRDVLSLIIISKIEQEFYKGIPDLTVRNTLMLIKVAGGAVGFSKLDSQLTIDDRGIFEL